MVYGEVDIDMIAGPSDVLIIADASANPRWLAADLLAQAEHDILAQAILVTTEAALIEQVQVELDLQLKELPRKDIAAAALDSSGKLILVKDLTEALTIANQIAPEHLELAVADPFALLGQVENAGSVFLGHHTPEVLGDYFAGPNHTLPTEGTARFYSPLSVDDFIKKSSYLYYPEAAKIGSQRGCHHFSSNIRVTIQLVGGIGNRRLNTWRWRIRTFIGVQFNNGLLVYLFPWCIRSQLVILLM